MVNPHCDPDWFLLRRTSIGPSLILNTFRRKKKTAADLKIWFVFYASRQGVVISISPEHNSPSLQPPCKHTAYVRRIYIGSDASTGECQQRIMSSVPLSAPCPVVLWTVTNIVLKQRIETLIYFVIWRRDLRKVQEICVTQDKVFLLKILSYSVNSVSVMIRVCCCVC